MKNEISVRINGTIYNDEVSPSMTLLMFIRERVGLTGTKAGCENGECGACTIIMNGKPVRSCLILAVEADGSTIETIEGLADKGNMHPLQLSFIKRGAVQCGFCTPGMLMAAKALYDRNPSPTEDDVKEAMGGHLCRCTGYKSIKDAIENAYIEF